MTKHKDPFIGMVEIGRSLVAELQAQQKEQDRLREINVELLEALKAKMSARVHNERVAADRKARAAIAKAEGTDQ